MKTTRSFLPIKTTEDRPPGMTTHKTRETLRALGVLPAVDFCKQPEGTPVVYRLEPIESQTVGGFDIGRMVEFADVLPGNGLTVCGSIEVEYSMDWKPLTESDDEVTWTWS